jgi:hypothetical protein|nr:MAG TPA: hypothetical protein [Caudoviricetes sp.]DAX72927.1 MAG TPA: hypothetical protein [Caudoviricetes sp.]
MRNRYIGKFLFRPDSTALYIFLIALAIFILGVQIGIKHGRELQLEDIKIEYGYDFSN